jgi:hypothetical protein
MKDYMENFLPTELLQGFVPKDLLKNENHFSHGILLKKINLKKLENVCDCNQSKNKKKRLFLLQRKYFSFSCFQGKFGRKNRKVVFFSIRYQNFIL